MLPLIAEATPTTIPELAEAITQGLQGHGLTPRHVELTGAAFPEVDKLSIDLTAAHLTRDFRPPLASKDSGVTINARYFEMLATPIYFEKAAMEVRLSAERVRLKIEMEDGRGRLSLEGADSGDVSVQTTRTTLETLFHALAVEAAARQGLEVRKTTLSLTQEGPLAISFRIEVTAKIFIMSAALALTGHLTVDEQLNARFSDLRLDGDGMILKLAGSYARPHLDSLEGRVFPLLAFAPNGLPLRDIKLSVGENLGVSARFGTV